MVLSFMFCFLVQYVWIQRLDDSAPAAKSTRLDDLDPAAKSTGPAHCRLHCHPPFDICDKCCQSQPTFVLPIDWSRQGINSHLRCSPSDVWHVGGGNWASFFMLTHLAVSLHLLHGCWFPPPLHLLDLGHTFSFLPAKSFMSDCAFITVITDIFFALLPTTFAILNCCRYLTEQCCLSWGWITARFFLCRVAEGMLLTNSLMNVLNTLVSLQSLKRSLFSGCQHLIWSLVSRTLLGVVNMLMTTTVHVKPL